VVKITSPASGVVASGSVGINASATDNVAVAKVAIYLDSVAVADTRKSNDTGKHVIGAGAWDLLGKCGLCNLADGDG
jgi:hypothetical protein